MIRLRSWLSATCPAGSVNRIIGTICVSPTRPSASGRVRPLVELPAHRHRQHLLPQGGDEPADEVERHIPVPQHGIRVVTRPG